MSKDDALDAAALIRCSAQRDRLGAEVILNNADVRAVAIVLARWAAGWLADAERLSGRPGWFTGELRSWCDDNDGSSDHPWAAQ